MRVHHYSTTELAALLSRAAVGFGLGDHVAACEQCHFLWALVRRARGEPSDEEREVTLDALRSWGGHSLTDDNAG